METKRCTKCGEEKELGEFRKGHAQCRPCQIEYTRKRRQDPEQRDKYLKYMQEYNKKYRESDIGKKKRSEYNKSELGRKSDAVRGKRYYYSPKGKVARESGRDRCKPHDRDRNRIDCEELRDRYVIGAIRRQTGLKASEIHFYPSLIDLKRKQIKLRRVRKSILKPE